VLTLPFFEKEQFAAVAVSNIVSSITLQVSF
jgi:hypothetical protein